MTLDKDHLIFAFGFIAQALFTARFVVQWIASERRKESIVPMSFWYFSIVGGTMLLIYAIMRQDPVFIMGQSLGSVIYLRNIYFIKKKNKTLKEQQKASNLDEISS